MIRASAVVALGVALLAAPARGADAVAPSPAPAATSPAAAAPSRFALAWVRDEGAESCPRGHDFAEEVTRRLGHSPFDDNADRTIEIHVAREGAGFASRVYVRERSGQVLGQRALSSGEDCAVLFSATVLAVALLIEPDAALQPVASGAVARFELPMPAPTTPTPAPASGPPSPPAATTERSRDVMPAPVSDHEAGSVALHSLVALGVVPLAEPGVELAATAHASGRFRINAEAAYVAPGRASSGGTNFAVGLTAFALGAGFDFVDDGRIAAGVEAGGWLGALNASLRSTADPAVTPRDGGDFLFVAVSAGLDLRVHFTRTVFAEARALALIPTVQRELQIASTKTANVWTQPTAGGLGTAGLGLSFF